MQRVYVCEYCGKDDFLTEDECNRHELEHELKEKLANAPEGAIICPDCKGNGWDDGSDGCDLRMCYTCGGKGVVIPKLQVTKNFTYEKI